MKKASEIFHPVDPELNIIDRGQRRKSRKATGLEWNRAGGVICPECGEETLRILYGTCLQCYNEKVSESERKLEDRSERRYFRRKLNEGTISLRQLREGRL